MKRLMIVCLCIFSLVSGTAQNVQIDGRLQPYLKQFFAECKKYNIDYHDKLFKLKNIDVVDTLYVSSAGSTLGMLTRDENNNVENIVVNYIAMLDQEILKVVAFHEFAHYFLEYSTHICDDCGKIMAVVNSSYFDIVNDWENQVEILFTTSPAYKSITSGVAYTNVEHEHKNHFTPY